MKKHLGLIALAFLFVLGSQRASAAQLITNGGFETGDFTGWTLSGAATTSTNPSAFYGVDTQDAASGTYGAYLGSTLGPLMLSQTLAVTPGSSYTVAFSLAEVGAPGTGFTNSFQVLFDGLSVFSETAAPASAYANYSFNVSLPSNSTTSTPFEIVSENDLGYFSLDNVSVTSATATATPEPASLLLVAPAAGLLFLLRRRTAA